MSDIPIRKIQSPPIEGSVSVSEAERAAKIIKEFEECKLFTEQEKKDMLTLMVRMAETFPKEKDNKDER